MTDIMDMCPKCGKYKYAGDKCFTCEQETYYTTHHKHSIVKDAEIISLLHKILEEVRILREVVK